MKEKHQRGGARLIAACNTVYVHVWWYTVVFLPLKYSRQPHAAAFLIKHMKIIFMHNKRTLIAISKLQRQKIVVKMQNINYDKYFYVKIFRHTTHCSSTIA